MSDLNARHCTPCMGKTAPMDAIKAQRYLQQLQAWDLNEENTEITRTFHFKNYYQTIAFVNAMAWISHQEDHHPVAEVAYNFCKVHYSTHAINGLSDNDFICAAKLNALVAPQ